VRSITLNSGSTYFTVRSSPLLGRGVGGEDYASLLKIDNLITTVSHSKRYFCFNK